MAKAKSALNRGGKAGVTSYDPKYCDQIVEMGKEGKSLAQMASILGFNRQTLVNWCDKYPEFEEAYALSQTHALAWWEDAGQKGMISGVNAIVWKHCISVRFKGEYTTPTEIITTGTLTHKVSINDLTDDELAAIAAGSSKRTTGEA